MTEPKSQLADVRVLRWRQVHEVTGKTRGWVNGAIKRGAFPRPVKLGARAVGWREREILEWIESGQKESRRNVTAEMRRCPLDYWQCSRDVDTGETEFNSISKQKRDR